MQVLHKFVRQFGENVIYGCRSKILDGKVNLYKQGASGIWRRSTYLEGKNRRASTRETALTLAKEFAERWFLDLKHRQQRGESVSTKTLAHAAKLKTKDLFATCGAID